MLPIPLDSVQEFRVTVGGGGANEGRSSGGQVALVTKGGSNQLHGSLYEYNRNTAFAANTWFNNKAGVPVQPLIRNQFGGSARRSGSFGIALSTSSITSSVSMPAACRSRVPCRPIRCARVF